MQSGLCLPPGFGALLSLPTTHMTTLASCPCQRLPRRAFPSTPMTRITLSSHLSKDNPRPFRVSHPGKEATMHPPRPKACAHDHQQCIGAVLEAKQDVWRLDPWSFRRHCRFRGMFCSVHVSDTLCLTLRGRAVPSPRHVAHHAHNILHPPNHSDHHTGRQGSQRTRAEASVGAQRSKQAAKARDFGEPSTLLHEASYLAWTQTPRSYIRPFHGR